MYHWETDLCLYSECQLCPGVTSFLIVVSPVHRAHTHLCTHARVSLCNVSMYVLLSVVLTALSSVTRTNANTHARFSKDTCRCSIAANYRVYVKKHVSYNWFNTHRIRTQARHTLMCMRGHVAWPYIALMSQCCTSF